jgi:ABC-type phosphate/phosphonate transport system substrate-binding protein
MRTRVIVALIVAGLLLAAAPAFPGAKDVLIYVTRMGGDSASAQPYIDRFLRCMETATGWPAGSTRGSFLVSRQEALDFAKNAKPGIGIMDPPLYFELRKTWGLQPIVQAESKDLVSAHYHLVVKDPAFKTVADLQGKRLWTTLADFPKYLSRVALGGQVNAAAHFELKQVGQALRGVRGVLRGDCEATILDDEQLAEAKKMSGGQDLRAIYSSPQLPPIPVVVFDAALTPPERKTLATALGAMCGSDKGAAICEEMHIDRFAPLNNTLFNDIQKRYGE